MTNTPPPLDALMAARWALRLAYRRFLRPLEVLTGIQSTDYLRLLAYWRGCKRE